MLSVGVAPAADNPALSTMLRSALTADGFFQEAHPKLRPVDLANEGEFLCGWAHSPRFMDETIAQAQAVAARASTILSKSQLEIMGRIAFVNPAGLRRVRNVRQGLSVRRSDDQRAQESGNSEHQVRRMRQLRGGLSGQDHYAAASGKRNHGGDAR